MKDPVSAAMVNRITHSNVFLAFIIKEYLEAANNPNSNAGKELNFATKIGVEFIISIILDPALLDQATWKKSAVLFHLPQTLYADFSSTDKVKKNFSSLLEELKRNLR